MDQTTKGLEMLLFWFKRLSGFHHKFTRLEVAFDLSQMLIWSRIVCTLNFLWILNVDGNVVNSVSCLFSSWMSTTPPTWQLSSSPGKNERLIETRATFCFISHCKVLPCRAFITSKFPRYMPGLTLIIAWWSHTHTQNVEGWTESRY